MNKTAHFWPGIVFFLILFFGSFALSDGAHMMVNVIGLIVVVAGTLGAAFMSYPSSELIAAYRVAVNSYRTAPVGEK